MKKRLVYAALAFLFFWLCVLIVKSFGHSPFIRGFIGDAVFVGLLYFAVKTVIDMRAKLLAVSVLMLAYCVEGLQYLQLLHVLGLEHNRVARLVFGAVYDPVDLVAYTAGIVFTYFIDTRVIIPFVAAKITTATTTENG